MKSKLIIIIFVLLGITALMSCEKEKTEVSSLSLEQKKALNNESVKMNIFAKILAKSLSSNSGRAFIKAEVIKEFDGDFEILFAEARGKHIGDISLKNSDDSTFENFLKDFSYTNNNLKSDENFNVFLNTLLEEYPLLQISMPELFEESTINWDEQDFIPLVAVLPLNFDENTTEIITAYDMDGNIFYLDPKISPKNPVIVISQNERLIAIKKDENMKKTEVIEEYCLEPYFETETYSYFIPIDCGGGVFEDPIDKSTPSYDRDVNPNKDQLNKATFVSIDAYRLVEGWPAGRPEFRVIISYVEKVGNSYQAATLTKILTKTDWVNRYILWSTLNTKEINIPIITWNKDIIGNSMKYTWVEQDNSTSTTELTIITSTKFGENEDIPVSASVKVTIGKTDELAGEGIVEYNDLTKGEGTEYNTGIVKFWINQL